MTTITKLFHALMIFLCRFLSPEQITGLTAPAAVESQVLRRSQKFGKAKRRAELREQLHRLDGGGKHYGSKRAYSNHKGSGQGKRSGRR